MDFNPSLLATGTPCPMDVGRTIVGNGKWVEKGSPGAPQTWNIEHKSTEETTDQKWHHERGTIPYDDHSTLQTEEEGQRVDNRAHWGEPTNSDPDSMEEDRNRSRNHGRPGKNSKGLIAEGAIHPTRRERTSETNHVGELPATWNLDAVLCRHVICANDNHPTPDHQTTPHR